MKFFIELILTKIVNTQLTSRTFLCFYLILIADT